MRLGVAACHVMVTPLASYRRRETPPNYVPPTTPRGFGGFPLLVSPSIPADRPSSKRSGAMMDGWTILIWGAVCGAGILAFLRIVAFEVERLAQELTRIELLMKRAEAHGQDSEPDEIIDGAVV